MGGEKHCKIQSFKKYQAVSCFQELCNCKHNEFEAIVTLTFFCHRSVASCLASDENSQPSTLWASSAQERPKFTSLCAQTRTHGKTLLALLPVLAHCCSHLPSFEHQQLLPSSLVTNCTLLILQSVRNHYF